MTNNVIKTESDFGLENHDGHITADGGRTYLPKYDDMTSAVFSSLIADIEVYLETELSARDINDLRECLRYG